MAVKARQKDEGGRMNEKHKTEGERACPRRSEGMKRATVVHPPPLIPHPLSFIFHPSSFLLHPSEGQASVWAMLALLVLVMVGAALLDAYNWTSTRVWAYHAAEAAAERGATAGADWSHFQYSGEWQLDSAVARSEAEAALREELSARRIDASHAAWDIRVHSTSAVVTEQDWPPKGSLWESDWTTDRPSVGVYLQVDTPTFLGGLAGIEQRARAHIFASSSLVR